DFVGLAVAPAHAALAVADHDERVEAEALAALDDLGATLDLDDDLLELIAGPALATLPHFGHSVPLLLFLLAFGLAAFGLALGLRGPLALGLPLDRRLAALRSAALGRRSLLFLLRLLGRLVLRLAHLRRLVLLLRVEEEV